MKKLTKQTIICAAVGAVSYAGLLVWGLFTQPGDEMAYSLLSFFIIMPLLSFGITLALTLIKSPINGIFAVAFTTLGALIPWIVFESVDSIVFLFGALPSALALIIGLAINAVKGKK